jgi:diketogulonate reductase-like aldo/keto reductase
MSGPVEYIRLGSSGLKVSRVCLGMMSYGTPDWRDWVLDLDASRPLVRSAVEAGVTFFDTADAYSLGVSEEVTGTLLGELFADRDDYVLATKVFMPFGDGPNDRCLSRKHILSSIDKSLRRLGTDHVDLYQIHRFDPQTPIEETMEALHDVVRAGKARYIGASSMYAWQFATMQHTADAGGWTRFAAMQDHYNLIYREEEREMHPLCLDQGVGEREDDRRHRADGRAPQVRDGGGAVQGRAGLHRPRLPRAGRRPAGPQPRPGAGRHRADRPAGPARRRRRRAGGRRGCDGPVRRPAGRRRRLDGAGRRAAGGAGGAGR